jgi:ribosomal-protein-alanine N-acetyltransferase
MTILTTQRLRLEPFNDRHFEELYYLNNDMQVMRYITGRKVSIDETLEHIALVKKNWAELGFSSWSIFLSDTNEFIGSGGIQHIEFNRENPIEMGWRLKTSKWGHGYATEAAQRMMQYAFDQVDVDTLYAICHQENKRSEGVMKRIGMHFQGIEQWYGLDTNVYRMTREYFDRRQFNTIGNKYQHISHQAVLSALS